MDTTLHLIFGKEEETFEECQRNISALSAKEWIDNKGIVNLTISIQSLWHFKAKCFVFFCLPINSLCACVLEKV